ncbi:heat-inducible transcriptional repressor HrcA [Corynebacterium sp. sy017]|uniref:heat-inducible transcriptional repressor HrcA n=1 Tax=unclassified Corynebacterium TaxID=2624378 RepID=UPI001185E97A|nr:MULTISPECIES: heat-inducible transcriptional repressor HrcA [unclassified Corynebacterium]MBP3088068.1 heat-inducible transcriptional repressor HrcA [Corynebacterium sp. sy017]QDZ43020.1 heat-inducible transcriptional repressor HrcA [Corynebacterium sp. sy039]TSD92594.1 heat-inducible transcriptional repressor HrcA [Corynebacterium sp. SY003]
MAYSAQTRRKQVLQAIVADYISSQEPVGSKSLVERYKFGVSSATIRNDMAALESDGYIVSQHTSSGRIPTQKAYRLFVDSLHEVKPLSVAERKAILSFLEDGVDLEDILRRSVQLLSQLTRQVAVVQLPNLHVARVKHCELVLLGAHRLLLVLITDSGRVEQRNVELVQECTQQQVHVMRNVLNRVLGGKTLSDASVSLTQLLDPSCIEGSVTVDIHQHLVACATVLIETLVEQPNDRLILAGASHLTRASHSFPQGLPALLEALEEQVVVLKLLGAASDLGQVNVSIGDENEDEHFSQTSVVATGYGLQGQALGGLGVVGPTYMDYLGTMSKVSAVAQYVGRVLDNSE